MGRRQRPRRNALPAAQPPCKQTHQRLEMSLAPAPETSHSPASVFDSTSSHGLHALPLQAVLAIALATAAVTIILLCSMRRCRAYLCLAVPLASCHPVYLLLPWA